MQMRRPSRAQQAGGELRQQVGKGSSPHVGHRTVGEAEAGKLFRSDIFFGLSGPSEFDKYKRAVSICREVVLDSI